MSALALSLAAGALFGLLIAVARWALGRGADAEAGAACSAIVATGVVALVGAAAGGLGGASWSQLWPYVALGAVVPGVTQIIFIHAVRTVGASRTAIVIGAAPLLSAIIAVIALDERPHAVLAVGTALIVVGGFALAWEKSRPVELRAIGLLLAAACAGLFATRDNVLRALAGEDAPPVLAATLVSLGAAAVVTLSYVALRQRRELAAGMASAAVPFGVAGLVLGLAYATLVGALDRGDVTLVAPLNATQSLWAIAFAALIIGRRADAISRRVVIAGVLVVAGSALVAAFR
ncbi:MAG: EamA family transporter [Gaiellaceae bacterium]